MERAVAVEKGTEKEYKKFDYFCINQGDQMRECPEHQKGLYTKLMHSLALVAQMFYLSVKMTE